MSLVECIPNFSEGRNESIVLEIAKKIASFKTIQVLDYTLDKDHNRSVITFTGEIEQVLEAAFAMTKRASELIDMTKQAGVHPRIGATDVIPLVPISRVSQADLVVASQKLARRIAEELGIPTFLYEQSARQAAHKNLADIRRGNLEGLKASPDFGTKIDPKKGATVVGVRDFLIAYNINLNSTDLSIAKKIAQTIRESNGGLKSVKALGLELKSQHCTQVSMNLVNFKDTNIDTVFDKVEFLAKKNGVSIKESELIGLIPEQAFKKMKHRNIKLPYSLETRILQKQKAIL